LFVSAIFKKSLSLYFWLLNAPVLWYRELAKIVAWIHTFASFVIRTFSSLPPSPALFINSKLLYTVTDIQSSSLSRQNSINQSISKWRTGRTVFAVASTIAAFASSLTSSLATLLAKMLRLWVRAAFSAESLLCLDFL